MKIKLSNVRKIKIKDEYIKLDALLKYSAVVSTGGEAKLLISEGEVLVNSEKCYERGKKLRSGDVIRCLGEVMVIA